MFLCEMILKLIGLGLFGYMQDRFNIFDGTIVIVGMLEFSGGIDSAGLTVLRVFRLLRIFKIVKSWTTLRKLLQTVISVSPPSSNLFSPSDR